MPSYLFLQERLHTKVRKNNVIPLLVATHVAVELFVKSEYEELLLRGES